MLSGAGIEGVIRFLLTFSSEMEWVVVIKDAAAVSLYNIIAVQTENQSVSWEELLLDDGNAVSHTHSPFSLL